MLAAPARLAPVTAVAGNTDLPDPGDRPALGGRRLEVAGLRILVCHIGTSLMGRHDPVAEGFDLVISGHSHKAAVEWRGADPVPQPRLGRPAALRPAAHGGAGRRGRPAGPCRRS